MRRSHVMAAAGALALGSCAYAGGTPAGEVAGRPRSSTAYPAANSISR